MNKLLIFLLSLLAVSLEAATITNWGSQLPTAAPAGGDVILMQKGGVTYYFTPNQLAANIATNANSGIQPPSATLTNLSSNPNKSYTNAFYSNSTFIVENSTIVSNSSIRSGTALVFEGDSITSGFGLNAGEAWPSLLTNLPNFYGKDSSGINNASAAGATISDMSARYAASVFPDRPVSAGAHSILMILIGSNDILSNQGYPGFTGLQAFLALSNYIATAKTDGFEVWGFTVIDRLTEGVQWTKRDRYEAHEFNRLLRESTNTWSRLMDIAPLFPDNGDTRLYQAADNVHPTVNGTLVIANFVNDAASVGTTRTKSGSHVINAQKGVFDSLRVFGSTTAVATATLDVEGMHNAAVVRVNTNFLYVGTNGNVGVGTAAPTTKFHVTGASSGSVIEGLYNTTSGAGAYVQKVIQAGTAGFTLTALSQGWSSSGVHKQAGATLQADGAGGLSLVANNAAGDMRLYAGGAIQRFTILANGNIGLGTISPSSTLDATGQVRSASAIITNSASLLAKAFEAPASTAFTTSFGAHLWSDGTNLCVVLENSAGTRTTNKLSMTAWP